MKDNRSKYEHYKPIIEELFAFAYRPGMYVSNDNMDLILAFLGGMELSSKFQNTFHSDLIEHIFQKYPNNYKLQELKSSLNHYTLKEQTEVLSSTSELTSVQIFKRESIELLVFISDEKLDGYFKKMLTSQLVSILNSNIESKNELFTNSHDMSKEGNVLRYFKEWPGKSLNNEEFQLLEQITQENANRSQKHIEHIKGDVDDKTKLRELSTELLQKVTRDNRP